MISLFLLNVLGSVLRGTVIRRCLPSELSSMYPKDWHDDAALRNRILSRVAELTAFDLLESSHPKEVFALQKFIYCSYQQRFARSEADDRALLIAHHEESDQIAGCVCVGIAAATRDGCMQGQELLNERDSGPSKWPAWPNPWERRDPLASARTLEARSAAIAEPVAPRALVDGLVVSREFRRSGVGRKLLSEAEMLASSWGQGSVLLRVEQSNLAALQFYATCGYETPIGVASHVSGRKLVADTWGCKWAPATDVPLQRTL